MMKYFIYCRKSSEEEERQALSIDAQITELNAFAQQKGLVVVDHLIEAMSAKVPGRPVLNHMLERIAIGEAQGIIAWNPDRLARNSMDGGRIIYMLDQKVLDDLKFPTFYFENTTQGKFNLSLAFAQAKHYTDKLSEDVRRGNREKIRRGEYPGKAPLGYFNHPIKRVIEPHPKLFAKVQRLLEIFATGQHTLTALKHEMVKMDVLGMKTKKPPVLSTVGNLLANPFYYGVFEYKGEIFQGVHKPMITKETYDKVQAAMVAMGKKHNIRNKRGKQNFLFKGFATCGCCGYGITAEQHTKKSGLRFVYYRCTYKSRAMRCEERSFVREDALSLEIRRNIELVSLPDEWREKYLAKVDVWETDDSQLISDRIQLAKSELASVKPELRSRTIIFGERGRF